MILVHVGREVFAGSCWLVALGWAALALAAFRGLSKQPDLMQMDVEAMPQLGVGEEPDLTVIVPACNEEESIQATLRSLLGSKRLKIEIIAVDDRSTDRTGALMDEVAAEARAAGGAHSLEVIHNRELPEGWLGKPHALAMAAERAHASWLLFTDGDVSFDEHALALALGYAVKEKADHVVLKLTMDSMSKAEAAVLLAILTLSQWGNRLWKVADPKARDFFGQGGFNLMRREVYEKLGGFAALRMEVVEDLRIGWKIKRAGYAQRVAVGEGLAKIRWMQGPLGIVGLLEKNGFAALRYRTGLMLAVLFVYAVHCLLPLAALASGGWTAVAGVLIFASIAVIYAAFKQPPWLAIFYSPAIAIVGYALARSMVLTLKRDGVIWRGTHYKLDALRKAAGSGW
jgi:glycosyltransferase involved in cell wall biosynthesis